MSRLTAAELVGNEGLGGRNFGDKLLNGLTPAFRLVY